MSSVKNVQDKTAKGELFSIGIDAGGSKTRGCSGFRADQPSKQNVGPGANPSRIGLDKCVEIFRDSIEELWDTRAEESDINLMMGVAGIEGAQLIPKMESKLMDFLNEKSPNGNHSCTCMTDIMLIGAIDLRESGGLSIILGTGSSFYIQDKDGAPHQGGGWGYILGDEGSGYGISKRAIQHIMRMVDGKLEDDFTRSFLVKIDGKNRPDVVNFVYQDRDNFHHLVRWVVERSEAGDSVASDIIQAELKALLTCIERFVQDRVIDFNQRIVLNGGLAKNRHIHQQILQSISESAFSKCTVELSDMEPAEGAWQLGLIGSTT